MCMSMFADAQTICHTPQVSSQQLLKRYMFKSKSANNSIYLLRVYSRSGGYVIRQHMV